MTIIECLYSNPLQFIENVLKEFVVHEVLSLSALDEALEQWRHLAHCKRGHLHRAVDPLQFGLERGPKCAQYQSAASLWRQIKTIGCVLQIRVISCECARLAELEIIQFDFFQNIYELLGPYQGME